MLVVNSNRFWREIQNPMLLSSTLTMIMTRLEVTQYYPVIVEESNKQTWLDRGPIKAADNTEWAILNKKSPNEFALKTGIE